MTDPAQNTTPADKTPPADNKPKTPDANTPPAGDNPPSPNSSGATGANNPPKNPDNGKQPAADIYKPDGIADHFLGKDNKETIDKLHTAVANFRKELAKTGVPESPDGYTLELSEDLKSKVVKLNAEGKDPVLEKLKPVLHKHNIPNAALQDLATEFYGVVAEIAGSADKKPDGTPVADFEFKELGGAEKAQPQIEAAETWIKGLEQSKKISDKLAAEMKLMTSYGEGLAALTELRALLSDGKPIPKSMGGENQPPAVSKAMIESRMSDPRYWSDKAFHEETDKMWNVYFEGIAQKSSAA